MDTGVPADCSFIHLNDICSRLALCQAQSLAPFYSSQFSKVSEPDFTAFDIFGGWKGI